MLVLGCEVGEARQEDRSFGDPGREKEVPTV